MQCGKINNLVINLHQSPVNLPIFTEPIYEYVHTSSSYCGSFDVKFARCVFRNMLLKATFQSSYLGLVEAKSAVMKKWLSSRTARYNFVSLENM